MKLYTICPDSRNASNYKPQEDIRMSIVEDVPCLTACSYAWVYDSLKAKGIDSNSHILPILLLESTKDNILYKKRLTEEYRQKIRENEEVDYEDFKARDEPTFIKNAIVKKNSNGITFLEEKELSQDVEVIVSLELPLSAAQPYYEFEGDVEILLGTYANYYGDWKLEAENQLCEAIIKMGNGAKVRFTYSNRYGQGILIKEMLDVKFEFICHQGKLTRLDEHNFSSSYSDFKI